MDVVDTTDGDELARRAAGLVALAARRAIGAHGRFCLAVSGGGTPTAMFAALAAEDVAWDAVHLFQVDERAAPPGHPERNASALRAALIDPVGLADDRLHLMRVEGADLADAAGRYAEELQRVCGGHLDLVHLGLGTDGHTASWPPGDPVVDSHDDVAPVGPFGGWPRLTLTPRTVNRAGHILWVVSGADKAGALRRLRAGDPDIPASRVRTAGATLVADSAALVSR